MCQASFSSSAFQWTKGIHANRTGALSCTNNLVTTQFICYWERLSCVRVITVRVLWRIVTLSLSLSLSRCAWVQPCTRHSLLLRVCEWKPSLGKQCSLVCMHVWQCVYVHCIYVCVLKVCTSWLPKYISMITSLTIGTEYILGGRGEEVVLFICRELSQLCSYFTDLAVGTCTPAGQKSVRYLKY